MVFSTGLGLPEGPVVLPDGSWLVVEMDSQRGCVTHISPDGRTKRAVARTGRPNGLAVDKNGLIWVAESETHALLRISLDGKTEIVTTACDGGAIPIPASGIRIEIPGNSWRRCRSGGDTGYWASRSVSRAGARKVTPRSNPGSTALSKRTARCGPTIWAGSRRS